MKTTRRIISLFSGGMGLDLGLEKAGLSIAVCVEKEHVFCETIRRNHPTTPVIEGDICGVTTEAILNAAGLKAGEAFAVVGGPPCQSFSVGGNRGSIQDERGGLFTEFLRVVREANPEYFVFENVAHIITAPIRHRPIAERPGQRWHLSSYKKDNSDGYLANALKEDEMSGSAIEAILDAFEELGYHLKYGVLNSAEFGVPQKRLRLVIIGSRFDGSVELPQRTHSDDEQEGLPPLVTLRDALKGLDETAPVHANYTSDFKRYFDLIPPGKNWRALPPELQREALGQKAFVAGGGKTGFFRRLSWDEPTPTILGKPNRKSGAICHPSETRPLTVRECARVQGFPDSWDFVGSKHDQYLQIGNAVPVGLGEAIGKALLRSVQKDSKSKRSKKSVPVATNPELRKSMLDDARTVIRRAARNRRVAKPRPVASPEPSLFPA